MVQDAVLHLRDHWHTARKRDTRRVCHKAGLGHDDLITWVNHGQHGLLEGFTHPHGHEDFVVGVIAELIVLVQVIGNCITELPKP